MADIHARIALIRHGQSEANAANVFTGWSDPPLTAIGREEANLVAHRLRAAGIQPTRIFCSVLGRCTETAQIITGAMAAVDIAVTANAALNERDYGALTGHNKTAVAERYGEEQLRRWRRSYAAAPPEGESLRDTAARVLAYYVRTILPSAMAGGATLIISHGNTLRALAMALDGLDAKEIERFDLLTGAAILYGLSGTTAIIERNILN